MQAANCRRELRALEVLCSRRQDKVSCKQGRIEREFGSDDFDKDLMSTPVHSMSEGNMRLFPKPL
jgi:hypothetical protein